MMIRGKCLLSIFLYRIWFIPIVLADDDQLYTNGSYLALRLMGALFFITLGLTFCFFGQSMISYIIFVAGLELFSLFTCGLALSLAPYENQLIILYTIIPIAGTITFIISLLAANFIKFGKLVLGVNLTVSVWLLLYVLGLFPILLVMIITLGIFILVGIILPFCFFNIIILSTTIVGCTLTMAGIDCIFVKGLLSLILKPGMNQDNINYYMIFMVISSIILGLTGMYVQNRSRKQPQQAREFKLFVSA